LSALNVMQIDRMFQLTSDGTGRDFSDRPANSKIYHWSIDRPVYRSNNWLVDWGGWPSSHHFLQHFSCFL